MIEMADTMKVKSKKLSQFVTFLNIYLSCTIRSASVSHRVTAPIPPKMAWVLLAPAPTHWLCITYEVLKFTLTLKVS
jgi:hypothetical protein